jgi:hypothetical protein
VSEPDTVVIPFDKLPRLPASGLRHSWHVHGPGDQLSTLNRLTGAVVAAAAATVRTGELFDFAAAAAACHRERRYEFLFTSVPLNLTGPVGSPANAVAIR